MRSHRLGFSISYNVFFVVVAQEGKTIYQIEIVRLRIWQITRGHFSFVFTLFELITHRINPHTFCIFRMKFTRNRWSQRLIYREDGFHTWNNLCELSHFGNANSTRAFGHFVSQIPNGDFCFTPGVEAERFSIEMAKVNEMATSSAKRKRTKIITKHFGVKLRETNHVQIVKN